MDDLEQDRHGAYISGTFGSAFSLGTWDVGGVEHFAPRKWGAYEEVSLGSARPGKSLWSAQPKGPFRNPGAEHGLQDDDDNVYQTVSRTVKGILRIIP